ncbi:hypothetical protein [Maritimibacter dapengensis]|uniref:Fluoroquinolone transport system permease protein n=1 Tax=Maritimibacter dapengensis TaxID=2836868 RepID=A0ABS6T5D2_9RHOB|nr:hypothetical protein [Maritimibacter dapengensis]MBV7380442.1 hypothetical protein [Maritimibacter dapengensis]
MTAFGSLLGHDARLQFRYGIYYAYAFVVGFYVVTIWSLGAALPGWFVGLLIYTDPAVVGFFFLGALMMLEKSEGVRAALGITPMTASDYFWAKTVTLSTLSVVAVLAMSVALHKGANLLVLLPTVFLTSVFYLGIGVQVTRLFSTVTSYLMGSMLVLLPIVLPAGLAFIPDMPIWAMLVPTAAQFKLILIGTNFGDAAFGEIVLMLTVSVVGAVASVAVAQRSLKADFGRAK